MDNQTNGRPYEPKDLLGEPEKPIWVSGLAEDQYHADKSRVGSSTLKLILKSEKLFYAHQFKGVEKKETKALKLGRLVHLEPDYLGPQTFQLRQ